MHLTREGTVLSQNYNIFTRDINESGKVTGSGWRISQIYSLPYYISTIHDDNQSRFLRAYGYGMGGTHINNHNVVTGGLENCINRI